MAGPAFAEPLVDPATDSLCAGYEEAIEGMWMDENGNDVLRFRLASNKNGAGCYAWLNAVPQWGIDAAGSTVAENVRRDGARRNWGEPGGDGVFVNLASGVCKYAFGRARATGRVIGRKP